MFFLMKYSLVFFLLLFIMSSLMGKLNVPVGGFFLSLWNNVFTSGALFCLYHVRSHEDAQATRHTYLLMVSRCSAD